MVLVLQLDNSFEGTKYNYELFSMINICWLKLIEIVNWIEYFRCSQFFFLLQRGPKVNSIFFPIIINIYQTTNSIGIKNNTHFSGGDDDESGSWFLFKLSIFKYLLHKLASLNTEQTHNCLITRTQNKSKKKLIIHQITVLILRNKKNELLTHQFLFKNYTFVALPFSIYMPAKSLRMRPMRVADEGGRSCT